MCRAQTAISRLSRTHASGLSRIDVANRSTSPRPQSELGPRKRRRLMRIIQRLISNRVSQIGFGLLVIVTIASAAFSQTQITTATMQGTVADLNGAVLPGATVEIKNLDTNLSRTATTDEGGRFVFLTLPPGPY